MTTVLDRNNKIQEEDEKNKTKKKTEENISTGTPNSRGVHQMLPNNGFISCPAYVPWSIVLGRAVIYTDYTLKIIDFHSFCIIILNFHKKLGLRIAHNVC